MWAASCKYLQNNLSFMLDGKSQLKKWELELLIDLADRFFLQWRTWDGYEILSKMMQC